MLDMSFMPRSLLFILVSIFILVSLLTIARGPVENFSVAGKAAPPDHQNVDTWCPLPENLPEPSDGLQPSHELSSKESIDKQVERLSAAVNVATVSYDDNGSLEEDKRWNTFGDFQKELEVMFPLVHEKIHLQHVNLYGLLYTYQGSHTHLKPIVFMAHQDVVPAGNENKWTHPPFKAHYDGKFVWGRGSADCKNNLIGILSVFEHLLSQNFQPKRTIILASGFDEETGGKRGSAEIANTLKGRYGENNIAMILDEGGMGLERKGNHVYAMPAIAEKGYMDLIMTLDVAGGHSSRPPPHSGIGVMSAFITALEKNNRLKPRLTQENPLRNVLECEARYSPGDVEPWLRRGLLDKTNEELLGRKLAESRGIGTRFTMQTSQAVTVIRGGDKANQLPESVRVLVNYRIAHHDNLGSIRRSIMDALKETGKEWQITIRGFWMDQKLEPGVEEKGVLYLNTKDELQPSPISPTGPSEMAWLLFAATIRRVFEETDVYRGKTVVPVGDVMTGNTDTIHYHALSRNIYRFSPAREGTRLNIHAVDERIDMAAHVEGMRLYYDLIRNFDQFESVEVVGS
ncbi:vacuolar carboxypeptidase Cps1 [Aulographum hederae CBS 113979]|uniref:Vacuolar carboxypeptidase Cps1 n=1 Tax=Aulographum hederae CBS 113979 TaxID=1176131 RepID=A0A6G1GVD1_9PEZI|nr:vacuolar carboxypeptidase Cps1 [Aulographum hederae CBS 113979]